VKPDTRGATLTGRVPSVFATVGNRVRLCVGYPTDQVSDMRCYQFGGLAMADAENAAERRRLVGELDRCRRTWGGNHDMQLNAALEDSIARIMKRIAQIDHEADGHAPGDLRAAFIEAVNYFEHWNELEPNPAVEFHDRPVPIGEVCGLLWNCSDILPGETADKLIDLGGEMRSRTYGAAARWLKGQVPDDRGVITHQNE
jgi:hypothetical protein